MKITKTIALFALTSFLMISCKNETAETKESATTEETQDQPAQLATASFSIEGMSCEVGCANHIEKKLAKLEGVQKAEVDFEAKKATVEYDANKVTPELLTQTVEGAADGKTYKVLDMNNSADQAMLFNKDKKKKKKGAAKESETSDEKKSCGTEKKAGCCASKKAETL
ncbi:cation transporter [Flavobacterium sp.]|uniref:cation transporter n=1 Tax=Flavobacterium sp. TaxID=239 RepID=UPI00260BD9A5|nr:cation transporter [Flavobacterium sp.]MDD2985599.1 cation transporter [Flavobacterium sp.]